MEAGLRWCSWLQFGQVWQIVGLRVSKGGTGKQQVAPAINLCDAGLGGVIGSTQLDLARLI